MMRVEQSMDYRDSCNGKRVPIRRSSWDLDIDKNVRVMGCCSEGQERDTEPSEKQLHVLL